MGRSLRKLKKTAVKVRVGVQKRSKKTKAPTPAEITSSRPDIQDKLKQTTDWDSEATTTANYSKNGFALDPNFDFQTNNGAACTKSRQDKEGVALDDDMLSALGKPLAAGKRPPAPLTSRQRMIVSALIAGHGDNVHAMARDRKLNKMLHPEAKLRQMLESYHACPADSRVAFQQPKKSLW